MQQHNSLTLPWPTDWSALFNSDRPLILEIGFGRGAFLYHLAETFPDHNIIGLEINNRCLVAAEKTITRKQWNHVTVIHSRAETALAHLFQPGQISRVYVNFPDPWFKRGHSHRRLMQRDTLDAIVSRMTPNGQFFLATDIIDYAEMSAELLAETPALINQLDAPWTNTPLPGRVVTKYEAKARTEGRDCYYFAYRRSESPAPDVPVIRELAMPHIVFTSPVTLDEIQAQFQPIKQLEDGINVHLSEVYHGRHTLLFELHLHEPTIEQHTALLLTERKPEPGKPQEFTLQMTTFGHPRPTRGIHLAVGLLGDWLLSLHPEAKPLHSKLKDEDD